MNTNVFYLKCSDQSTPARVVVEEHAPHRAHASPALPGGFTSSLQCVTFTWPASVGNAVMRRHQGHQPVECIHLVALEAFWSIKHSMFAEGEVCLGPACWHSVHLPLPVWKRRWCHDGTERSRSQQESAMHDLMEVSRCQLHFLRAFQRPQLFSPLLDGYTNPLVWRLTPREL